MRRFFMFRGKRVRSKHLDGMVTGARAALLWADGVLKDKPDGAAFISGWNGNTLIVKENGVSRQCTEAEWKEFYDENKDKVVA